MYGVNKLVFDILLDDLPLKATTSKSLAHPVITNDLIRVSWVLDLINSIIFIAENILTNYVLVNRQSSYEKTWNLGKERILGQNALSDVFLSI